MYRILRFIFCALSLLPMRVLYCLADCGFVIVYHVVRYRRGVVSRNLATSFPEKSEAERRSIERRFYRWFCDYLVEAVKLLTISEAELRRRFTVVGADEVERFFDQGRDCAAILGHYCNWEWLSCVGIAFRPGHKFGLIYHPLRNEAFDRLFRDIRSRQASSITVPKKDILRQLITLRREGTRSLFGYISDQGPKWANIHLWLPFLGHDTPVFTGGERIMHKMGNAVFYVEMQRPCRGKYTCTFKLITPDASKEEENFVTKRFFEMLEQTIRRNPQYYLWTHNRWKRTHEEFDRRFKVENGKVIART